MIYAPFTTSFAAASRPGGRWTNSRGLQACIRFKSRSGYRSWNAPARWNTLVMKASACCFGAGNGINLKLRKPLSIAGNTSSIVSNNWMGLFVMRKPMHADAKSFSIISGTRGKRKRPIAVITVEARKKAPGPEKKRVRCRTGNAPRSSFLIAFARSTLKSGAKNWRRFCMVQRRRTFSNFITTKMGITVDWL